MRDLDCLLIDTINLIRESNDEIKGPLELYEQAFRLKYNTHNDLIKALQKGALRPGTVQYMIEDLRRFEPEEFRAICYAYPHVEHLDIYAEYFKFTPYYDLAECLSRNLTKVPKKFCNGLEWAKLVLDAPLNELLEDIGLPWRDDAKQYDFYSSLNNYPLYSKLGELYRPLFFGVLDEAIMENYLLIDGILETFEAFSIIHGYPELFETHYAKFSFLHDFHPELPEPVYFDPKWINPF